MANSVIFGRSDFFSNPEIVIKGNGNDTIIGKGGADTYHAGNGSDYIRISDLNFKLVDGGSGDRDTLGVGAVDANLDLTNFSGKITGIERIYLYGQSGSDSGVTLNATQLKALSDTTNKLIKAIMCTLPMMDGKTKEFTMVCILMPTQMLNW